MRINAGDTSMRQKLFFERTASHLAFLLSCTNVSPAQTRDARLLSLLTFPMPPEKLNLKHLSKQRAGRRQTVMTNEWNYGDVPPQLSSRSIIGADLRGETNAPHWLLLGDNALLSEMFAEVLDGFGRRGGPMEEGASDPAWAGL